MRRPRLGRSSARRRTPRATWPNRGLAVALVAGGALLGWLLPRIERNHRLGGFAYDPAAAQATLGAIATGVITLTGFVLTAVTLVVQSVQSMSPRLTGVLGYFERSLVMFGALTGTAVYALVVLAQVGEERVPRLSVSLAIVFVVLSTGAILRRIAELREMVTGGGLVRAVGLRLHTALDHVWRGPEPARADGVPRRPDRPSPVPPHGPPGPAGPPRPLGRAEPPGPAGPAAEIRSRHSGIVQHVDAPAVAAVAARLGVPVTCLVAVGSFVEPGATLLRLVGGPPPAAEVRRLARAVRVGPSRTIDHDPAYGLRILVDIAIRALSPAVNDPTTAVQALDQIESALLRIARRPLGTSTIRDSAGGLLVTVPRPGWTDLLDLAFAEVLHYGAGSLQVHRRMRALLDTLARDLPRHRVAALAPYRAALDHSARALSTPALTATATTPDPQGLGGPHPGPPPGRTR